MLAITSLIRMRQNILLIFVTILAVQLNSCDFAFIDEPPVEYDPKSFDSLAESILNQHEIFEMDDFSRYSKTINYIQIKLPDSEDDRKVRYLKTVLDSLGIDSGKVNALRTQLRDTRLREFERSGDSILFIVDGLMDTSWGFMYSRQELKMDSTYFSFRGNSVKYVDDINSHWKKTQIK